MIQDTEASTFREQFRKYRISAHKRGISFDLSIEEFKTIAKKKCFYCGVEPRLRLLKKGYFRGAIMNGIDRYDNSLGYTLANSVPCCSSCNYFKKSLHGDEFILKIKTIYTEVSNHEN